MSIAKEKIANAYQWAVANRPKVNGYPYLAEALKQAGVLRYVYHLPSCQCIYFTQYGNVASQSEALTAGMSEVPKFDQKAFIKVLRQSQMGDITFLDFLKGSWEAGVISYDADLSARKVSYYGANGESYVEDYPAVEVRI
jgi:uncharacterized protein YbcV (DUF1398 family)